MKTLQAGSAPCGCEESFHEPRFIVLTGGPGAGKTAVLEFARQSFCPHVAILPEAAGILFSGGFPRHDTDVGRRAAQRAIFRVQRELEEIVRGERRVAVALCDRGTPDGFAYWPGSADSLWAEFDTNRTAELDRYAAVIHLQTPRLEEGYDFSNPLRVETPEEARRIDARIAEIWAAHPRRFTVVSGADFLTKAERALEIVRDELPVCCREHPLETASQHPATGEA